jgi:hypothetical protein
VRVSLHWHEPLSAVVCYVSSLVSFERIAEKRDNTFRRSQRKPPLLSQGMGGGKKKELERCRKNNVVYITKHYVETGLLVQRSGDAYKLKGCQNSSRRPSIE